MSQTQTVTETFSVWAPTEKGASLNPKWWKPAATLRHPKPSGPKLRIDKSSDAYQARLEALPDFAGGAHAHLIGRQTPEGFYLVATDGHRALLRPGTAPKPGEVLGIGGTADLCALTLPDGFAAMCTRLRVCTGGQHHSAAVQIASSQITIKTNPFESVIEASEYCETDPAPSTIFGVNLQYLIDGLGRPCRLWYHPVSPKKPVIIEAQDGSSRYVLMPLSL